jgi:hypothetical protein
LVEARMATLTARPNPGQGVGPPELENALGYYADKPKLETALRTSFGIASKMPQPYADRLNALLDRAARSLDQAQVDD